MTSTNRYTGLDVFHCMVHIPVIGHRRPVLHAIRIKKDTTLYKWIFERIFRYAGHYPGALLFATWFMLMCWFVGWWMNKRKIYFRI